jgi:glucoamylase
MSLRISWVALALVRFGLRAPDDPRILNTLKVIDALLRVKLPQGFCWYRYNGDGYGEQEDGSPFEGPGSAAHGRY